jgi:Spy/CpxP family protein refolding chaperone
MIKTRFRIMSTIAAGLLAIAGLLVTASPLFAVDGLEALSGHGPVPGDAGHRSPPRLELFLAALDLPPEQEQTIRDFVASESPRIRELAIQLKDKRRALMSLDPAANTFDRELVTLAGEVSGLAAELVMVQGTLTAQVYTMLTPAQQARAVEFRDRLGAYEQARRTMRGAGLLGRSSPAEDE